MIVTNSISNHPSNINIELVLMEVCQVTDLLPGYHKLTAGAEQACYILIELLTECGQDVTVLSTVPSKMPKEKFHFYAVPTLEDYLGRKLGKLFRAFKWAFFEFDPVAYFHSKRLFKMIRPDIVHFHAFSILSYSLALSARRLNIPTVFSVYDYGFFCPLNYLINYKGEICDKFHGINCIRCLPDDFHRSRKILYLLGTIFRRRFFDFYLSKIDLFIVLSKASAWTLQKYGIDKRRIRVVPYHLSQEKSIIQEANGSHGSLILYVGHIEFRKGLHILLNAMPTVIRQIPDAELYVVGEFTDEGYKKKIVDLVNSLGIMNSVLFLGRKPHEEVINLMSKVGVVVIPEQWNSLTPVLLPEAMALAKPIVASRTGGFPEYLRDGENGFLVNPKMPAEFAERITFLLRNRETAVNMGRNAKESLQNIDSGNSCQEMLYLYTCLKRSNKNKR